MDLAASMRALRRQWILTGFLLVLTFVAGVAAWVKMPGPYQTQSMVVLVPSQQASKLNGNNPYMSYGGQNYLMDAGKNAIDFVNLACEAVTDFTQSVN